MRAAAGLCRYVCGSDGWRDSIRGLVPLLIVERFEGSQGCANGYRFYPPPHQPSPAARLLRLLPGQSDCPWERGRPARILIGVAEHQRDFAGSRHVGSNRNGQAEGGPRRRCRSIQVEELAEAVPGIVRAGRPRSQEAFIHTINRKHGLHRTPQRRGNPCGCPRDSRIGRPQGAPLRLRAGR